MGPMSISGYLGMVGGDRKSLPGSPMLNYNANLYYAGNSTSFLCQVQIVL